MKRQPVKKRPSGSGTRQRQAQISIRLLPTEYERVRAITVPIGISMAALARAALIDALERLSAPADTPSDMWHVARVPHASEDVEFEPVDSGWQVMGPCGFLVRFSDEAQAQAAFVALVGQESLHRVTKTGI